MWLFTSSFQEKAARDKFKRCVVNRGSCLLDQVFLPSQNKHLHEQINTVESIGCLHRLHDTGSPLRLFLDLFADDTLDADGNPLRLFLDLFTEDMLDPLELSVEDLSDDAEELYIVYHVIYMR